MGNILQNNQKVNYRGATNKEILLDPPSKITEDI